MAYITRDIEQQLEQQLGKGRAIVIYGPRQSGKTTLARRLLEHYDARDMVFYEADRADQTALFQPTSDALRRIVAGKKVVCIDEAQVIENAGLVLKLLVDSYPEVQVIATGSSSFQLSDKIKESMVGRVYGVTLLPLSAQELTGDDTKERLLFNLEHFMQFGGYPRVTLSNDIEARKTLTELVDGYLYKDVLDLTELHRPEVLPKLLTALALQVGHEVSYHELANLLEVNQDTVERYLYLLEQCYVIFRLYPLSSNPRKLLASRKRKVYFYDLGVRNVLAGQLAVSPTESRQLGGLFENFCILERLKARLNHQLYLNPYYWRSPDSEIDYVEQYGGKLHAYEFKWNKRKQNPPPRFRAQFPDATYQPITKDNFWELLEAKTSL